MRSNRAAPSWSANGHTLELTTTKAPVASVATITFDRSRARALGAAMRAIYPFRDAGTPQVLREAA